MRVDKLYEGQVFKNYRVMCEELEMPIRGGNSKKLQMEDLHRYCATDRSGNSIIVREVFDFPIPKIDGRGRRSIYAELLQVLFTDYFLSMDTSSVKITRNTIIKEMNMTNENYHSNSFQIHNIEKETGIPPDVVRDFYNITRSNFRYMVESTLDNLRDRALIMYNTVLMVSTKDDGHRTSTPLEKERILACEREVLDSMGYVSIGQVISSGRWRSFKSQVQYKTIDFGVRYYYYSYDVTINTKHIEEGHNQMLGEILNKIERSKKKNELNSLICSRLIENSKSRRKNTKKDSSMHSIRSLPSYEEDSIQLIGMLIESKIEEVEGE